MNIPEVTAGFQIGPFTITNTIVWTWIILGVLAVVFIILGSGLRVRNISKKQVVAEAFYGLVKNMVTDSMGEGNDFFVAYFVALFGFLLGCNLSGFWGLGIVRPPTADIVTPMAMALLVFVLTQYNHIKTNGIKAYLKSFIEPIPVMLPMNLISELANPVSLTFRMFGNLLAGLIIGTMIYSMLVASAVVPTWIAIAAALLTLVLLTKRYKKLKTLTGWKKKAVTIVAVLCFLPLAVTGFVHGYFDIFAGILQSYVFCILSTIFIS